MGSSSDPGKGLRGHSWSWRRDPAQRAQREGTDAHTGRLQAGARWAEATEALILSSQLCEARTFIPVLQTRKLRLMEIKGFLAEVTEEEIST